MLKIECFLVCSLVTCLIVVCGTFIIYIPLDLLILVGLAYLEEQN